MFTALWQIRRRGILFSLPELPHLKQICWGLCIVIMQKVCTLSGVGSTSQSCQNKSAEISADKFQEVTKPRQYFTLQLLLAETSMEMSFPRIYTLK